MIPARSVKSSRRSAEPRRRRRELLGLGVLLALALTFVPAGPVHAASYSSCKGTSPDRSYKCTKPSGYAGQKYWGLGTSSNGHNCATFVAYVMAKSGATGTGNPGWAVGGLPAWPANAKRRGIKVNATPAKGAIYFDIRDRRRPHVAIVVAVGSENVYFRDDNWSGYTRYWRTPRSGFNSTTRGFIHVNDAKVAKKLNAWGWDNKYGA